MFLFQVIHPEAMSSGDFAMGRNQKENVQAVIHDILRDGNSNCMLPGQIEADAAKLSDRWGGLLFTEAEVDAFNSIARECGQAEWNKSKLPRAE